MSPGNAATSVPRLSVVFWGHACFGIHLDDAPFLLIDPFDPRGLGETPGPPALPVEYPHVVATHEHSDHAAFHTQPSARVVGVPGSLGPLALDYRSGAHDPLGGRLRGGSVRILELRLGELRVVHASDLGERPQGALLDWLCEPTPDLLIVPAGGYFTLNADGAAELVARVQPRHAVFCHTQDDGLPLPQLDTQSLIRRRSAHWPSLQTRELHVEPSNSPQTTVVWMERPDAAPLQRIHG